MKRFLSICIFLVFFLFAAPFFPVQAETFTCIGSGTYYIEVNPSPVVFTSLNKVDVTFTVRGNFNEDSEYYLDFFGGFNQTESVKPKNGILTITQSFLPQTLNERTQLYLDVPGSNDQQICNTVNKIIFQIKLEPEESCAISAPAQVDLNDTIQFSVSGLDPNQLYWIQAGNIGNSSNQVKTYPNSSGVITDTLGPLIKTGTYSINVAPWKMGNYTICSTSITVVQNLNNGNGIITPNDIQETKTSGPEFCSDGNLRTAIGCIPTDPTAFAQTVINRSVPLGAGFAFLLILFGAFTLITSAGNPENVQKGKEIITSAIIGLLVIIFSIFILRLIGIDILNLNIFT